MWDDHYGNCWVTLTYRDPWECDESQYRAGHYIDPKYTLRPDHVSKFIRRLRKTRTYEYDEEGRITNPIKYFYCGEYGDENGRPHYHVCLFNCRFDDQVLWKDDEGLYTYTSPTLEKLWPYGFSTVAELNYETAAYTARYSLKKVTGLAADDHYMRCDEHGEVYWLLPEFIRMSTGNRDAPCGLGVGFYEKFKEDIFPSDESPVPGKGVVRLVPRYYQTILESENPEQLELVKNLRQEFIKAHGADFTPERLRDKYHCAKARLKKRNL